MADQKPKQKLKKQNLNNFKHKHNHHNPKGQRDEEKDKLKRKLFQNYKKMKRKQEPIGLDVQKLYREMESDDESHLQSSSAEQVPSPSKKFEKKKQASRFSKAQWEHQKKAQKKKEKFTETKRRKEEKEEALRQYRARKKETFLKLCKRTSKGQPVMKYHMQVLLEKLEKQHKQTQAAGSSS